MKNLSLTSLELACWIAKLGSFTAAAERLHTTQPAVSARVRELEEIVGQKLFMRQGRGVELTLEGREFVRGAERLLAQLEELTMSFSKASATGVVRVGTTSICLDLLSTMTQRLSKTMPRVSFDVEIERAGRLLERLELRKLELAIVSGPVERSRHTVMSLGFDRMLWVTSPRLLRERRHQRSVMRLEGLPVWCVHRDSFYWGDATRKLVSLGADLDRINSIDNTLGAARIVSGGSGIGLLSETLVRQELKSGSLVPVPGIDPCDDVEFSIVSLREGCSRIVLEIMAMAVASSQFRKVPLKV
jgi:DNA-binding transcriptional LysR family regulator